MLSGGWAEEFDPLEGYESFRWRSGQKSSIRVDPGELFRKYRRILELGYLLAVGSAAKRFAERRYMYRLGPRSRICHTKKVSHLIVSTKPGTVPS